MSLSTERLRMKGSQALMLKTKEKLVDKRGLGDKHELGFVFSCFSFNSLFPFPIKVSSNEKFKQSSGSQPL